MVRLGYVKIRLDWVGLDLKYYFIQGVHDVGGELWTAASPKSCYETDFLSVNSTCSSSQMPLSVQVAPAKV